MRLRELLLDDAATIEPQPPLTPAQARREAERKAKIVKRAREVQAACATKLRDLRAKL
jgi:hypothetical protein